MPWLKQALTFGLFAVFGSGEVSKTVAAASGTVPVDPGPGGSAPVRPFRLDQVALGNGLLQEKRDLILEYLREYDERRFLVLFNEQVNRTNPEGISVPGGWEEGGLLSGHWTGHFMTALSQAYADQEDKVFKENLTGW